jgi:uncharacterized protein
MTNSPEPTTPDSTRTTTEPGALDGAPGGVLPGIPDGAEAPPRETVIPAEPDVAAIGGVAIAGASGPDPVLDTSTFDRIKEPRSDNRLPLGDGTWHQVARAYVWVRLISLAAFLVVVVAVATVISLLTRVPWPWIPGGIIVVVVVWLIAITPRQARAFGYQLRSDDLLFRRGILWQRMVGVPYGRMQLVDVTHGPLDRAFGIAQLRLVTAAASTGVVIPGLTQEGAERLRDTLIAVAETRRTGL